MTGVFYFAILLSMKSKTTAQSKNITIFTDGSSLGNPGKGGYGAVLAIQSETNTFIHEIGGRADMTTNNRMELTAVIQALTLVHQKYSESLDTVTIHSDSCICLEWYYVLGDKLGTEQLADIYQRARTKRRLVA
jgi:hypothetical protein